MTFPALIFSPGLNKDNFILALVSQNTGHNYNFGTQSE